MRADLAVSVPRARRVRGTVSPPGDKSISHRYALLAALADGRSRIDNYAPGRDCAATLGCLRGLGVDIARSGPGGVDHGARVLLVGRGLRGLGSPAGVLDAQNSGSTMRMLAGVLAAHPFTSTIGGDASLERRPMKRVIEPLERMGARIESRGGHPPLTIIGNDLRGINFAPSVPSAQVKSAVLLAGLHAAGSTTVTEPTGTRNHTELALAAFGVQVEVSGTVIRLEGGQRLTARDLRVPGDLSSAAFWAAAAAALPGSEVTVTGVGLNPSRTQFLEVLRRMGARVETTVDLQQGGEPSGTIVIRHDTMRPLTLGAADVPGVIDELPVLAALATHGGELTVTGAGELRVKESDRIRALVQGLRALGADADELPDGFHIRGSPPLRGGAADSADDHRLAMAFAIAALGAQDPCTITGADAVGVSYPGFFEVLASLCE